MGLIFNSMKDIAMRFQPLEAKIRQSFRHTLHLHAEFSPPSLHHHIHSPAEFTDSKVTGVRQVNFEGKQNDILDDILARLTALEERQQSLFDKQNKISSLTHSVNQVTSGFQNVEATVGQSFSILKGQTSISEEDDNSRGTMDFDVPSLLDMHFNSFPTYASSLEENSLKRFQEVGSMEDEIVEDQTCWVSAEKDIEMTIAGASNSAAATTIVRDGEGHFRRIGSNVSSSIDRVYENLTNSITQDMVYCQVKEVKHNLLNHFDTLIGRNEFGSPLVNGVVSGGNKETSFMKEVL